MHTDQLRGGWDPEAPSLVSVAVRAVPLSFSAIESPRDE